MSRFNTVTVLGKRITLRPNGADRPGRTVAYRSLPAEATGGREGHGSKLIDPQRSEALPGKVPSRGTPSDGSSSPLIGNAAPATAPESRRLTGPHQSGKRFSTGGALPGYPTPLDTGLSPSRIRRLTQAADRGAVAPGTAQGRTGALGFNALTNGASLTIPHIRIPRTPITVTAFRRTIDTTSGIPARGIASPLR